MSNTTTIPKRIQVLVGAYGSLRAVARVLKIDHSYLQRLSTGEKTNPSKKVLEKLSLKAVVTYEMTPWKSVERN